MSEEHEGAEVQGSSEATEPVEPQGVAAAAEAAESAEAAEAAEATEAADAEHTETETQTQVEVALVRSVRHGRIILTATVIGAAIGMIAALLFPVEVGANYELGQIVGLMAVVGAVVGLVLGSALALVLGVVAKRRRGAALAIQTDVQ